MLQPFILVFFLGSTLADSKNGAQTSSNKLENLSKSQRAEFIRNMTQSAFAAYQTHAWSHDLLLPVTENFENRNAYDLLSSSNNKKGGGAISSTSNGETILESLTTLWIMGLKEEFTSSRDWLLSHHLNNSWLTDLAPLLSAHALSGDSRFLERAIKVADYWLPRYRQLDRLTGNNVQILWSAPELKYLAQVTGEEEKYFSWVDADYDRYKSYDHEKHDFEGFRRMFVELIYFLQEDFPDSSNLLHFRQALTKMTSSSSSRRFDEDNSPSTSFGGDYSGVPRLRTGARPPHRAYIATDITKRMSREDCTYGALFALASAIFTKNGYRSKPEPRTLLGLGRALADTCHRAAASTSTGLPPEAFYFDVPGVKSSENDDFGSGNSVIGTGGYSLTPHLAQTYYILYQVTGDEVYQQMAWKLVVAIEKFCKVEKDGGYSSVKSVNFGDGGEPPEHLDIQPPVFLGATLKYLYLIFDDNPANRFPVNQWVFTFAGHPILAHGKRASKRQCLLQE